VARISVVENVGNQGNYESYYSDEYFLLNKYDVNSNLPFAAVD